MGFIGWDPGGYSSKQNNGNADWTKTIANAVGQLGKAGGGTVYAPPAHSLGSGGPINSVPSASGGGDGGGGGYGGGGGGGGISAAEASARQAGKDRTARENQATQAIIDALMKSLGGYAGGRDTKLANAEMVLKNALSGIQANYDSSLADYNETGRMNEQDEAGKTAANLQNRARERSSLLEQAASLGAGETDQLRSQLQAFQNFDANALEISRAFNDTQRSINSQIAGANNQSETARRNAWNQNQDQKGDAWNEYWKNMTDTWTNIQRTAAQNSNIDSDYSTGFTANLGGKNAVDEVAANAGKTYKREDKDEKWYSNFAGRSEGRNTKTNSSNSAAATTIAGPKAAEGATLRGKW